VSLLVAKNLMILWVSTVSHFLAQQNICHGRQ